MNREAESLRKRGPRTLLTRAAIATGLQQQCYIVRDGKGQALTYVYFEEEPGRPARLPSC